MNRERLQGSPLSQSLFLIMTLVLCVVISVVYLLDDRGRIRETAHERMQNHIWILAEYAERLFDSIDGTFLRLARDIQEADPARMPRQELDRLVQTAMVYLPEMANCLVLDAEGTVRYVMYPGRSAAIAQQYRTFFERHRDQWDQVIITSQPPVGNELGYMFFSRRLQDRSGEFKGILLAAVAPEAYFEEHRHYDPEFMDAVLLLDSQSRVIASWPMSRMFSGDPLGTGALGTLFSQASRIPIAPGATETLENVGGAVLMHSLARYPLRVAVGYTSKSLFEAWSTRRNIVVFFVTMLGILGVWSFIASYGQRQMVARARSVLMRREQDYRQLAENFPAGIIMLFDRHGRITIAEGQGLEAAGLHRVQMEGHLPEAFFPEDVASVFAAHHAFVLSGKYTTFTLSMQGRIYQGHSLPLMNDRGDVESGMTVLTDVTRREEYETVLRRAKDAAEHASQVKGQFVANISHELRTPISGIMGITEVALSEGPPQKWRRHFTIIKNVSDGLLNVINDVLDFSRIEAGKLSLDNRPFNLFDLVGGILEAMRLRASQKGLVLDVDFGHGIEPWLSGDPGRLRQVLVNLIDNAIKFTEGEGRIHVSLTRVGAVRERQGILFSVTDTGIGIPENRLDDLFDSFSQVDGTLTRQYGGSGLGLSICRHLVELMGGNLRVESTVGKGSKFYFSLSLPVHVQSLQPGGKHVEYPDGLGFVEPAVLSGDMTGGGGADGPLSGLRILLAEDNELNQEFLTYFLEDFGHVVTPAHNGEEALQRIAEGGVDIVLMDVQMPVLSGVQATRMIREMQGEERLMPVVALTAHALSGDRERFLKEGMDAFVGKPVGKDELFTSLQQAWQIARSRGWKGGGKAA